MTAELRGLGVEVIEDDRAGEARAGAGNLVARVPGRRDEWVGFCAHLDTVPHDRPIEVVLDEGVYRSRGETILGADNKAAVTVLCELLAQAAQEPGEIGVEVLFTVAEEDGLRGAKAFDASGLRAKCGFVLDHASPIGEVITAAPSYQRLVAEFEGVEAHAGIRPEAGRSAIAAAASAVATMELGRIDEETTTNVGVIGGGSASNVVAAHCRLEGEARSIDPARAAEEVGRLSEACAMGASEHGCDVDVSVEELFRGYRTPSGSRALGLAEAGLRKAGYEPSRVATGGGSDANALLLKGLDCVLLANGTVANHTADERVEATELDRMLDVCLAIWAEAAC